MRHFVEDSKGSYPLLSSTKLAVLDVTGLGFPQGHPILSTGFQKL